jgi:hypothetical protein
MKTEKVNQEIYTVIDGVTTKVETKVVEYEVPSIEEEIKEKEDALLKIYEELKALKGE